MTLISKMSTQYDTIQVPYDEMRTSSIVSIEQAQVQSAISPFIKDAKVLDLACESAFYSYDFLKWGARKVVGVDISSEMIQQAQAIASSHLRPDSGHIEFLVADCSKPVVYDGGLFNVVVGAWLLNYAATKDDLVDMFRNVALNLKDGGQFVAVCPPGTQDPAAFYKAERSQRPQGSCGLMCEITGDVQDGISVHVSCRTKTGDVHFDCFHLTKDVYEAAAREAGVFEEINWSETTVPDDFLNKDTSDATLEELQSYRVTPRYGILMTKK